MACGTSTGGITGKLSGRVGDTPLVGAGGYCDDLAGASSAADHGESIARVGYVVGLMQSGCDPQEATERPVTYIQDCSNR